MRRHPYYLYFFYLSSSLLIVVKEASLLWRAKASVGSSYGVININISYKLKLKSLIVLVQSIHGFSQNINITIFKQ